MVFVLIVHDNVKFLSQFLHFQQNANFQKYLFLIQKRVQEYRLLMLTNT